METPKTDSKLVIDGFLRQLIVEDERAPRQHKVDRVKHDREL